MLSQFGRIKENLQFQKQNRDANQRLFPVTELYFNKRYEVGEKHLVVYDVRLLSRENITYKQERKTVRK